MQVCRDGALALCKWFALMLAGLAAQTALAANNQSAAAFKPVEIGVSWSNFQEERWKRDEAAIKHALAMEGAEYVGMDAQASNEKQMKDIDALLARGVKAIIVLAWDAEAILPAVRRALAKGVPVIAYDRLIQDKDVFYITFDNVEVGRIQAREVLKKSRPATMCSSRAPLPIRMPICSMRDRPKCCPTPLARGKSGTSPLPTPTAGNRKRRRPTCG